MALFGHDDNVRRLSSNLSTGAGPNYDDDVTGDDVTGDLMTWNQYSLVKQFFCNS